MSHNSDLSFTEMMRDFSVELMPGDARQVDTAIERLPPRTVVSLTWIPGSNLMRMIGVAAELRRAGLIVMPHIGARHLQSRKQLEELSERLVGEASVDRVLIIGGDRGRPAGPFDSSLAVMQSGVFQRVGIFRMAVAGFPEGNPHLPSTVLNEVLEAKAEYARRDGVQLSIVTQFCFSAGPIVAWLRRLRASGLGVPVRIGLAGPAGVITLLRYAVRCGVGNSAHVLSENPAFAKALTDRGPEPIIRDLISSLREKDSPEANIAGLHFYVFGGLSRTLDWIAGTRSRRPLPVYS